MFSIAAHFVALLPIISTTTRSPLESSPASIIPPSISLTILTSDNGVVAHLLSQGNSTSISIDYSTYGLEALTDVTERWNDRSSSIVMNIIYPAGWLLELHDPKFEGWAEDIDEIHIDSPLTDNYSVTAPTPEARNQRSVCGASNATFTIATRITALGGMPSVNNPYPATVNISHRFTTMELVWLKCNVSSVA